MFVLLNLFPMSKRAMCPSFLPRLLYPSIRLRTALAAVLQSRAHSRWRPSSPGVAAVISVLRKFHGRRLSAPSVVQGVHYPIHEKYFESGGIRLTRPTLSGVVVRARSFFNCFTEDSALSDDPTAATELKCLFWCFINVYRIFSVQ